MFPEHPVYPHTHTHTHTHLHIHTVTQTQIPSCFQAQGAGEKRLPNFPSWSTRLHMQMLITTGACMGQSAGCWNSLCISLSPSLSLSLSLSPHRSPFPQLLPWLIIKIITSDFLHGSFSPARFWKARAPLSDSPRWALIGAPGPWTGRGEEGAKSTHHLPRTHQRGTDSFSQGLRYGGSNECEIIHPVWCNCGWNKGPGWERGQIRWDGCYHTGWRGWARSAQFKWKAGLPWNIDFVHWTNR